MKAEFTKRRFLSFPEKQQQKLLAQMVRKIYEAKLANQEINDILDHYNLIQTWLNSPFLEAHFETLSNRFHIHLTKSQEKVKEHRLLPTITQTDKKSAKKAWPLAIYLDKIRSAHNVGSIIRTTEALSLGSLYFSEHTPFIDNKQVQDAAMGTDQWVKCQKIPSLNSLPKPLIILETCKEAHSLYEFLFPLTFTLVVGNEEYGVSNDLMKQADHIVTIPLRGRKNSLNVANAFAIAASEIHRQRSAYDR